MGWYWRSTLDSTRAVGGRAIAFATSEGRHRWAVWDNFRVAHQNNHQACP
jgi:hypothetical protein